jgi:ribosome-binding protein aMBF1 (putative translation factor)
MVTNCYDLIENGCDCAICGKKVAWAEYTMVLEGEERTVCLGCKMDGNAESKYYGI